MKDHSKIVGKTTIVIGSGRGIDRGVAAELASYGVKVMVADINDKDGVEVRDEIIVEGGAADYCHYDVYEIRDTRNLVVKITKKFGTIDILINNVGGGGPSCDLFTITDECRDYYTRFNLYSAPYMIRGVFPHMKEQKKGKIVNISPGHAIGGGDFCAHYASAEAGVIGLTTSTAKEEAPYGIDANMTPAPTTNTPGLREVDFELVGNEAPLIPLRRTAIPEGIANTMLFLVSESTGYVAGQIVAPNRGGGALI